MFTAIVGIIIANATISAIVPKPVKILSPPSLITLIGDAVGFAASSSEPRPIIHRAPSPAPAYVHQKQAREDSLGFR